MSAHPFLSLQSVYHGYQEAGGWREVLKGADLELESGAQLALIGQSGSGKSTLLHLLGGLDFPREGRILVDGEDLTQLPEPKRTLWRRRHVGFIYQFFNLIPTLSVAENCLLPLEMNGISASRGRSSVLSLLDEVGLKDRAETFPDRLSGGEQQRVALVRALIHQPRLVLADEPTGNLDAENGEMVLTLLDRLVKSQGRTLILVTHSLEVAERLDRTMRLVDGRLCPSVPA
jgi:putative ABC transport system ATP-binding protein